MLNDQLQDYERPLLVFIDTSIFDAMKHRLDDSRLRALAESAHEGRVLLIMPDITHREILRHVSTIVAEARQIIQKLRREASCLQDALGPGLASAFNEIDWQAVRTSMENTWKDYLESCRAEMIPIGATDAVSVFDDYFNMKPPFGEGKKKSEFPDAFIIKGLVRYAVENQKKVIVVSGDSDFERACQQHEELVFCDSLAEVIEVSLSIPEEDTRSIHELLYARRMELDKEILKSFVNRGFYWDTELPDAEVEEIIGEDVVALDLSVIGSDGNFYEVAGEATISFSATGHYAVPDMCYRDDETREMVYVEHNKGRISTEVIVPVKFKVNLAELRRGRLAISELSVNSGDDIVFACDDIDEIYDDFDD